MMALLLGIAFIFLGLTTLGFSLSGDNSVIHYGADNSFIAEDSRPSISIYMAWYPLAIICGVVLLMAGGFGIAGDIQKEKRHYDSFRDLIRQYYNYERQRIRRFPPNT
jgi:hypothetical protein